jgi:hypothetical protein
MLSLALVMLLAAPVDTPPPAKPSAVTDVAPSADALAIARRIILKMRVEDQQRAALRKVAPLFAISVLSLPADRMPPEIRAALQEPDGRLRVAKIVSEEYINAFEVRIPQLGASMATQLAKDLPLADLRSIDAFLDTPAGQKWGGEMTALQQAAGEAGRKAGQAAGEAAGLATIQRLRGKGTGS